MRESSYASTNLNKCATLRHGGRYGGSLTDRGGMNPVLKKASTPSVATVSKETQLTTDKTSIENELNNNNNHHNTNSTKTTSFTANTSALIGDDSGNIVSGYETDTGVNFAYKRSIDHQNSNTMKYDHTKINNNTRAAQPAIIPSVYSIDASYQTLSKSNQQQHQQNIHKVQQPPPPSQIQHQTQYQYTQIQHPQPPTLPVKQHQHQHQQQQQQQKQHLPQPNSLGVSIINQPLPDIPQTTPSSHAQRNPQPLSASNLEQYRAKSMIRSEFDSNSLKYSHNTRTRTVQTRPAVSQTQTLKHHSSTSMATNTPPVSVSMATPPPLPQKVDQPPMLPPKNRNKDHHTNKSALKQTQKQNQTHSNASASQKAMKSSEHGRYASEQHQPTIYSTFGYEHSRDNRRYVRETSREPPAKSSSYSREYHAESNKPSSRHQTTIASNNISATPHRTRDHSHGMLDAGGRMSDFQYQYDAGHHRQQYSQHADHHGTSTYPHRRVADEAHTYRTTETNRRNYNRDRGDSTDLTGIKYNKQFDS